MTPIAEALKKEHPDKKDYWQNELKSLGIERRRQNELNDKEDCTIHTMNRIGRD